MKVYNLRCAQEHRFEGWFSSEEDFNAQSQQLKIECPVCSSADISKLPSAPHLNLSNISVPQQDTKARLHAQLQDFARQVLANTDDVGEDFAEEARRIHYNEALERNIRGVTTSDEREALAEEGIDVIQFPIPDAPKQPLQ